MMRVIIDFDIVRQSDKIHDLANYRVESIAKLHELETIVIVMGVNPCLGDKLPLEIVANGGIEILTHCLSPALQGTSLIGGSGKNRLREA
jgi:hypothetical protein